LQLAGLLGRATQDYQQLLHGTALAAMWRRHGALTVYPDAAMLTADLERWQQRSQLGALAALFCRAGPAAGTGTQGPVAARHRHAGLVACGRSTAVRSWFVPAVLSGRRALSIHGRHPAGRARWQVRGVILADGSRVLAERIVIASGVWSDAFARQLGQTLPLESERGYHLTLPHAGMPLRRYLLNAPESFVILPMANGGLRLAGTVELASRDARPTTAAPCCWTRPAPY
jgi:D-amino-acid dehydrogenase